MPLDQLTIDLMEQAGLSRFAERQAKLGQLSHLMGLHDQQRSIDSTARVRDAEDAAAVKMLTGKRPDAEDDVGMHVVFGDVNHPAPSPPPVKSGMGTLAKLGVGAALLASGVGAGVAIPLIVDALRRPVATPVETIKTETVTTESDYSIGEISVERR